MQTKWLALTIILIVFGLGVAGWLQQPKIAPSENQSVSLHTYKDPQNVFTVSVPTNWTTKTSTASSTTGLHSAHPVQQSIQVTQLTKPAEAGLTMQVINGTPTCPAGKPETTIAGLPAYYNPAIYTWTIPTTTNTILISAAYPGTNSFHQRRNQPVPTYSETTIAEDKKLVMTALASLKLNNLEPLPCKS